MYQDFSGFWHESRPGEFMEMMNSGRRWPNGPGQQAQSPQQAQNPKQDQNFPHRQADIIFLKKQEDMDAVEVKSGYDQIFAAEDDTWFAVKSAVGNGYTTKLYLLQEPAPSPGQVDMSQYVTKKQIAEALPGMIATEISNLINKQREDAGNGTV
jgi:hypothetical protein